jgi:formylglycine-generating enzyme required for sulfatase activity
VARKLRTPNLPGNAFSGALRLSELADGRWELSFNPAGRLYRVRTGEKIRYPGRARRGQQDWLRLPVTGISVEDAEAYAAWLSTSGRVPGARLCREDEWERAARGADDREFPHGNRLEPDDANHDETYGKDPGAMGPDEVGSHPASRSPFGLDDMAGNAFEWVVSSLAPQGHAARGGSYLHDVSGMQVANRQTPVATYRDASVGMRVCATFR